MQEVKTRPAAGIPPPPTWPKVVVITVTTLMLSMWLGAWWGWVSEPWGMWALSSGVTVIVITVAIWRELPGSELGGSP